MPIILTISYFIFFILVVIFFSKKEGCYSTVAVFGISCYIYYIGIPFELYFFSIEEFRKGQIIISLSTQQLNHVIIMGIIALLSFSLGYYLSSFKLFKTKHRLKNRFPEISYSIRLIFIFSLVTLFVFFYNHLFEVNTYEAASGVRYRNPGFSLVSVYIVLYGAVISSTLILAGKSFIKVLFASLLIISIISYGIYSSDKNIILFGLLAVAASFSNFIRRKRFLSFFIIIIGCGVLIYLAKVFSLYRGGHHLFVASNMALKQIGIRFIDPLGPFASIQHMITTSPDLQYGKTYLHIFYLIIPQFLWHDRPLDLSEQFARDHMLNWVPGNGMGYSPLAESYLNFSFMGPIIQYLMIGFLWGYFWKILRKLLWHFPQNLWQCLYYVFGYYVLILMHRGPVAGLAKMVILYAAPLIVIAILFDLGILHPNSLKLNKKHKL